MSVNFPHRSARVKKKTSPSHLWLHLCPDYEGPSISTALLHLKLMALVD